MPQICCFYIHTYSTYKHIFTSIEQLWDIWLKSGLPEAAVGICSSPESLIYRDALNYMCISVVLMLNRGDWHFFFSAWIHQRNPRRVIQSVSSGEWVQVWRVAVVTVVWPVTGSALGPVEQLMASNVIHTVFISPSFCVRSRILIFLWTWYSERFYEDTAGRRFTLFPFCSYFTGRKPSFLFLFLFWGLLC